MMKAINIRIRKLFNEKPFTDLEQLEKTALIFAALVLAIISLIMSVLNIVTMRNSLILLVSSTFCVSNLIFFGFFINIKDIYGNAYKITKILFLLVIEAILIYFFVSGNPEGFGTVWVLIVPVSSGYYLNKKYSYFFSLTVFATTIFFCWTALGKSLLGYDFSAAYLMRFPIAYFAFLLMGYCIVKIRNKMYHDLNLVTEKYEHLAKYDSLTKIYNRQSFEIDIQDISFPAVLLMFDLDDFKIVNDTYGHICGDDVLKEFSLIVRDNFLDYGKTYRWGGEEFIVHINNVTDLQIVYELCSKVMASFQKKVFTYNDIEFKITTSIGLLYAKTKITNQELINTLDKTLYRSKEKGKNCCTTTIIE